MEGNRGKSGKLSAQHCIKYNNNTLLCLATIKMTKSLGKRLFVVFSFCLQDLEKLFKIAFAPYLPHFYWCCLPPTQLQLCCGLYRNAECADEGKLLSSKLADLHISKMVKFDFPLFTCDDLISKNCQNWDVKLILLNDNCVVVDFCPIKDYLFLILFLYAVLFFGKQNYIIVYFTNRMFAQDEITDSSSCGPETIQSFSLEQCNKPWKCDVSSLMPKSHT